MILSSSIARIRLDRALPMFERLGGQTARRIAEAYFADPTPETFEPFMKTCLPLYNPTPLHPDVLARVRLRPEVAFHFFREEAFNYDWFGDLARIRCPTLILAGELDPITPVADQQDHGCLVGVTALLLGLAPNASAGSRTFYFGHTEPKQSLLFDVAQTSQGRVFEPQFINFVVTCPVSGDVIGAEFSFSGFQIPIQHNRFSLNLNDIFTKFVWAGKVGTSRRRWRPPTRAEPARLVRAPCPCGSPGPRGGHEGRSQAAPLGGRLRRSATDSVPPGGLRPDLRRLVRLRQRLRLRLKR